VTLPAISLIPVPGLPAVKKGDNLASLIIASFERNKFKLADGDILVVTQKVVSKAEGRILRLDGIKPGRRAKRMGRELKKDPRLVAVILREAKRVVRTGHGVIITETRHGFVCANSGVDQSNVEEGLVTLLPENPDRSAAALRDFLLARTGRRMAVIITDTFGRPWREGQVDVAIGCAGIRSTRDFEGVVDPFGYTLQVTEPAVVDEIAAAAELVMGKIEMVPVAVVRGLEYEESDEGIRPMLRKRELDLFR
jgi:coenzyme F420-0:L-glutamate ligase/coenzyme F420-1:gamma-L-glutamate ligase